MVSIALLLLTLHAGHSRQESPRKLALKKTMSQTAAKSIIKIRLVGKQYERPPLLKLTVDVILQNGNTAPRWFLLPDRIAIPPLPVKTGIDGVVVSALGGQGRVIVARFAGTGRFQAILLPAGAEVTLRNLPITFRGQLPKSTLPVEAVIAKDFTVAGEAAAAWLGINPMSDMKANVSEEHQETLLSKDTTGLEEVPVTLIDAQKIKIVVKTDALEQRSGETGL